MQFKYVWNHDWHSFALANIQGFRSNILLVHLSELMKSIALESYSQPEDHFCIVTWLYKSDLLYVLIYYIPFVIDCPNGR